MVLIVRRDGNGVVVAEVVAVVDVRVVDLVAVVCLVFEADGRRGSVSSAPVVGEDAPCSCCCCGFCCFCCCCCLSTKDNGEDCDCDADAIERGGGGGGGIGGGEEREKEQEEEEGSA